MKIDLSKALRDWQKFCNKCSSIKSIEDFWVESRAKDGRRSTCRTCHREVQNIWENKNKEKRVASAKEWELVNRDKRNNQRNDRRRVNRDIVCKKERERYHTDQEYRRKKIERASIQTYKRRLMEQERDDGTLNINATSVLFDEQWWACNHCGIDLLDTKKHLDHIVPISKWWMHSIYNVQWLCVKCNLFKWNRFIW